LHNVNLERILKLILLRLQKPDTLTTSGRFNCINHKLFKNKHLIPAMNGQFTLAKGGQGHWLMHAAAKLSF
jgi:hypothetical protein